MKMFTGTRRWLGVMSIIPHFLNPSLCETSLEDRVAEYEQRAHSVNRNSPDSTSSLHVAIANNDEEAALIVVQKARDQGDKEFLQHRHQVTGKTAQETAQQYGFHAVVQALQLEKS